MKDLELMKILKAPRWLRDRRQKLKTQPPPSLEEVRQYFAASIDHDYRHRYDDIYTTDSKGRQVVR
jgi:hypothetical protein